MLGSTSQPRGSEHPIPQQLQCTRNFAALGPYTEGDSGELSWGTPLDEGTGQTTWGLAQWDLL